MNAERIPHGAMAKTGETPTLSGWDYLGWVVERARSPGMTHDTAAEPPGERMTRSVTVMVNRDETPTEVFPTVTTAGRATGTGIHGAAFLAARRASAPFLAAPRPRRPIPAHRIVLLVVTIVAVAALLASLVPNAIARHRLASACSTALNSWTDQRDRISDLVSKADRTSVRVADLNKLSVTAGFDETSEGSSLLTAVSQSRNRAAGAMAAGEPECASWSDVSSIRFSTHTMTTRADMLGNTLTAFDTQLDDYQKARSASELSSSLTAARMRLDEAIAAGNKALDSAETNADGSTASTARILSLKALLATGRNIGTGADALKGTSPSAAVKKAVSTLDSTATKISDAAAALGQD